MVYTTYGYDWGMVYYCFNHITVCTIPSCLQCHHCVSSSLRVVPVEEFSPGGGTAFRLFVPWQPVV